MLILVKPHPAVGNRKLKEGSRCRYQGREFSIIGHATPTRVDATASELFFGAIS
jgi:hypothetical protein